MLVCVTPVVQNASEDITMGSVTHRDPS